MLAEATLFNICTSGISNSSGKCFRPLAVGWWGYQGIRQQGAIVAGGGWQAGKFNKTENLHIIFALGVLAASQPCPYR